MISRVALGTFVVVGSLGSALAQPEPAPTTPPADPAGAPQQPIEEPPPGDIEGTDENPDAPKDGTQPDPSKVVPVPDKSKAGYPIEEALRPITLFENMSEVAIDPHAVLGLGSSLFEGAGSLRARYGITREFQIGLTYVLGGVFHKPQGSFSSLPPGDIQFKPGKAVGLDFTYLVHDYVGIRLGVPIYIDPIAVGLTLGVPIKVQLNNKIAVGGLDDLLNFKLHNFAPSFYSEGQNARYAFEINSMTNTSTPRGELRLAGYVQYQQQANLAIIGRIGATYSDFSANRGDSGYGGQTYFLRGGLQYSPKRWFDIGFSLGWESLADLSSLGLGGFAAVRI